MKRIVFPVSFLLLLVLACEKENVGPENPPFLPLSGITQISSSGALTAAYGPSGWAGDYAVEVQCSSMGFSWTWVQDSVYYDTVTVVDSPDPFHPLIAFVSPAPFTVNASGDYIYAISPHNPYIALKLGQDSIYYSFTGSSDNVPFPRRVISGRKI